MVCGSVGLSFGVSLKEHLGAIQMVLRGYSTIKIIVNIIFAIVTCLVYNYVTHYLLLWVYKRMHMCILFLADTDEYSQLQEALVASKTILSFVNSAVTECENSHKLLELHRRLDKKSMENSSDAAVSEFKVRV